MTLVTLKHSGKVLQLWSYPIQIIYSNMLQTLAFTVMSGTMMQTGQLEKLSALLPQTLAFLPCCKIMCQDFTCCFHRPLLEVTVWMLARMDVVFLRENPKTWKSRGRKREESRTVWYGEKLPTGETWVVFHWSNNHKNNKAQLSEISCLY